MRSSNAASTTSLPSRPAGSATMSRSRCCAGDRGSRTPDGGPGAAGGRSVLSMTDDLAFLDATAQAELVRTRQLSPVELVDAAINRIEKLNPELNAVIHPRFDQARYEVMAVLPAGPVLALPALRRF